MTAADAECAFSESIDAIKKEPVFATEKDRPIAITSR